MNKTNRYLERFQTKAKNGIDYTLFGVNSCSAKKFLQAPPHALRRKTLGNIFQIGKIIILKGESLGNDYAYIAGEGAAKTIG